MMPVDQSVPIASRVAAPPRMSINTVAVSSWKSTASGTAIRAAARR
jgi:hypothetical protein